MPIAIAYNHQTDPYLAWQADNGATFCERMRATITAAQCEKNREYSKTVTGDCRCNGCGGLHDQVQPQPSTRLILVWDAETAHVTNRPSSNLDDGVQVCLADLDSIIDDLYANPLPDDDFNDVEIDLDDEQLLALFPELAANEDEDNAINYPRFTEYQTEMPRYAVYKGRCRTCGGYMHNIRENHDDDVFRCLACGWRTGVEYEHNRNLQKIGMVFR